MTIDTGTPPQAYTSHAPVSTGRVQNPIRSIIGASSGNLVEWFDFYVYAFTALYFSAAFFPGGSPTAQLMKTSGVYALGFFAQNVHWMSQPIGLQGESQVVMGVTGMVADVAGAQWGVYLAGADYTGVVWPT